ncbi:uncharacterized protein LOC109047412 isoform X1 [Cyprinus carpio]|uniref:Uncharacterized protein LOC109047412 isoform X1 n=1 Tax=Cyprinus carpio TaxID=7962 RepID=A0A9Q9UXM9_CYPCA|nr:uncharacterized protein LOC109047412 isoform X1 [Cyprinus carpio]XP_042624057.1 uncharacterized protein LOC109047412 isoform X1 [Cyprinus carpio]XP_042624058.1 uncharacterized protein LOC109047412 isoform X1 [Cyprinus carpio]
MNAVIAVQLFILVWIFTAVCQADKDIIVSCQNVTGSVGKEVILNCSVSLQITECCITKYKFQYPEIFNDSAICRRDVPVNSCEQRNSFTCSYTPTTAMTKQFRFFVQTNCGVGKAEIFTLEAVSSRREQTTSGTSPPETASGTSPPETAGLGSKETVFTVVVVGFIIILIMTAIICRTKPNFTKLCRGQNWMFLRVRHDEDNNRPGNEI